MSSKLEAELKQAVDRFINYPGKYGSTAYPMALADLEHDLTLCLTRLNKIVNSFTDVQKEIYNDKRIRK